MKRSGQYSRDPHFDPVELFDVIERDANTESARKAMLMFIERGDPAQFSKAVAVFVRSARAQGASIELVLGRLQSLADQSEGLARLGFDDRDTPLRQHVLRGVLLAFYGEEVVRRETAARDRCVAAFERDAADAPQRTEGNP